MSPRSSFMPTPREVNERSFALRQQDVSSWRKEDELDILLKTELPERALPIEADLLKKVESSARITEGLARVTLKAIAIGHVARQLYGSTPAEENQTYATVGMLIGKMLHTRHTLHGTYNPSDRSMSKKLTGVISEASIFALAAFNTELSQPLAGKFEGIRPRYILPTIREDDKGESIYDPETDSRKRTGRDFTITYVDGDDPHRLVQVKTSHQEMYEAEYVSPIVVVALETLSSDRLPFSVSLPRAIAKASHGQSTEQIDNQISSAAQRLNDFIQ